MAFNSHSCMIQIFTNRTRRTGNPTRLPASIVAMLFWLRLLEGEMKGGRGEIARFKQREEGESGSSGQDRDGCQTVGGARDVGRARQIARLRGADHEACYAYHHFAHILKCRVHTCKSQGEKRRDCRKHHRKMHAVLDPPFIAKWSFAF